MKQKINYKKMLLEFLLNGGIAASLSFFLQYHDWNRAITFGMTFGLLMTIFYTFILPRFKK